MSGDLVEEEVLISFRFRLWLLVFFFFVVVGLRPDVRECRLICFVRRIIDDRLFLRSRGSMALWAVGVATTMEARVGKAASFWFAPFEIVLTHIVLVYRWRLIVWPGSVVALGWVS